MDYAAQNKLDAENERLKNLGVKVNEISVPMKIVPFYINEKLLGGFWIDPDIHDDTKTMDIIFYVNGNNYRTPYTDDIKDFLVKVLTTYKL